MALFLQPFHKFEIFQNKKGLKVNRKKERNHMHTRGKWEISLPGD